MYLKSIEIQGFKSFANKIKFEFHNGITGIVGPNGSGKSNVADAVRWVLGEQRVKQLRGSSMQDVIFAGTQARRPLGFAYVAITLDNADGALPIDYREVTVARRIYRSGESEYLLNGTVCRLRDVNELFYDTGIGKEGYSIIGQGQIDRILSDKPQDRRALFDEAAGIVKYKHRKEQTLKRLESERDNLTRLTDIVGEREKQIPSLERQQEKAREYLKRRDALKRLDINAFLIENEKSSRQLEELTSQETTASSDLEDAKARSEKLRQRIENLQENRRELESRIEAVRSRITDASIVHGRIEGDIKVLEEQIRGARQRTVRQSEQEKILNADIAERTAQEQALSREIHAAREAFQTLETGHTAAKEAAAASSGDVERLREELEEKRAVCRADREVLSRLEPRMKERARVTAEYDLVNGLYQRLAGKLSGSRMDLETYVQRVYLQRILAAANVRFTEMSGGQFELRIIDEEAAGEGKNRGLDLMVYSTVTGRSREVRTLSGGESFMAALSLALGMADQIQESASAINEGFGSLDDHARSQAVRVLQQMASGSRLIGIISHVTELKQELEDQLIVTKDEEGSRVRWQLG